MFDYVDGAAESEASLARARRTFADVEFQPRVLRDVSEVDTSTTVLGRRSELPFAFAPTGFTRMMHHEGEAAVARAAEGLGIPFALSTLGTTTPEGIAAAAPDVERWFQLYVWHDRDGVDQLVGRAAAAGFSTLMLTVDTPVAGARLRDVRNGLTIPPSLTLRTLADVAQYPSWWLNLLTTEPLSFASFSSYDGTVADLIGELFDPSLDTGDLTRLRELWDGSLVVKGIQTVEDAHAVVDLGADAIVLSNHGGRQLDKAPTPLHQLRDVVAAVGDRAEVFLDGGILSGADIVAAVALGADATLVGRAFLYGLMAGGQEGVVKAGGDPAHRHHPHDAAARCPQSRRARPRPRPPPLLRRRRVTGRASLADDAVDPFAEEVGVAVMARVLLDQVHEDPAQRHRTPPPIRSRARDLQVLGLRDEPVGERDLDAPQLPRLGDDRGVGDRAVEVAVRRRLRPVVGRGVESGHRAPEPAALHVGEVPHQPEQRQRRRFHRAAREGFGVEPRALQHQSLALPPQEADEGRAFVTSGGWLGPGIEWCP